MAGKWRHNPLTSEAEAFRWLVVIALGAGTVIVVAEVISSLWASLWALLLILAGITFLWRDFRAGSPSSDAVTRGGDGRYRVLVMANQTVRSPDLLAASLEATEAPDSEILLVVPTLISSGGSNTNKLDPAAEHARQRMELTVLDLKAAGRRVTGRVGEHPPNQALRDALGDFPADEIIVSTLPPDRSHWLEHGVVERARIELGVPVRHIVWDGAMPEL